jgi:tRNA A-37 threonylcarbamoyl transferase component Bud32
LSLSCPRCDRPSAIGETCPEHGLHGVAPGAREHLDDAPLLGRILNGQFALTGLIGQGGMGTVYRGVDLALHRELAVKVLHANLTATRKDRERFEREARALSRLRSPATVTLYQFGVVRDGPLENLAFMAMELVEGTSLARRLARGALGLAEVVDIFGQLADSLGEAHQLGIVHRDLKPENVLLTRTHDDRLRVKVIDFGIARLEGATRSGSGLLSGTPHYMAPEQCSGTEGDTLDGRVDVYAAGVILFQALSGQRPFDAADALQILVQQVNTPAPPLPGADAAPALNAVVQRALRKSPAGRYPTLDALARDLRAAVAQTAALPVPRFEAPAPPPGEPPAPALSDTMAVARGALEGGASTLPPASSRRWGLAAVAVVLGGALAAGAALFLPPAPPAAHAPDVPAGPVAIAMPAPASRLPETPAPPPVALTVRVPESAAPIPATRVTLPVRRNAQAARPAAAPHSTAPAPPAPPSAPGREAELRALSARTLEALQRCRCAEARSSLAALAQLPGGAARASAEHLSARSAACTTPDVDETCVAGQVRPR